MGLGELKIFMVIVSNEARLYKPATLRVPPPIERIIYSTCNNAILGIFLLLDFDPNEWCVKKVSSVGGGRLNARQMF
jgi:hypothetical protein